MPVSFIGLLYCTDLRLVRPFACGFGHLNERPHASGIFPRIQKTLRSADNRTLSCAHQRRSDCRIDCGLAHAARVDNRVFVCGTVDRDVLPKHGPFHGIGKHLLPLFFADFADDALCVLPRCLPFFAFSETVADLLRQVLDVACRFITAADFDDTGKQSVAQRVGACH